MGPPLHDTLDIDDCRDAFVAVESVSKRYGDVLALRDVSLRIAAGEIVAILGPNGAGKTTLTSLIAGVLRPDRGQLRVGGADPTRRDVQELIGFAPQRLGVYEKCSVRENLDYFANLYRLPKRRIPTRVAEVADQLGLTSVLDKRVRQLSGGFQRRVHTALAVVHEPKLVLLDEPTVGADTAARTEILNVVKALAARGTAVIYTTHYLPEVESLGEVRVAILDHGSMVVDRELDELVRAESRSVVEFVFSSAAPPLSIDGLVASDGRLRGFTHNPGAVVADVIKALGGELGSVEAINITQPSLESVYLSILGSTDEVLSDAP